MKHGLARNNEDINKLKSTVATMEEKDKGISEKIDNINANFKEHDIEEMKQYNSIDLRLRNQARMIWIGFGILLASQYFLSLTPVPG